MMAKHQMNIMIYALVWKEHLLVWHKGIIWLNNMYLGKKWNDLLLFLVILFALFSSFIDN